MMTMMVNLLYVCCYRGLFVVISENLQNAVGGKRTIPAALA